MHALLWFWFDTMLGGSISFFIMCLLQASCYNINKEDWYEEERY